MSDLYSRIIISMVGSCECQTKTPDKSFHDKNCRYRVLGDCLELVEAVENLERLTFACK
jgi:hypothetical protein